MSVVSGLAVAKARFFLRLIEWKHIQYEDSADPHEYSLAFIYERDPTYIYTRLFTLVLKFPLEEISPTGSMSQGKKTSNHILIY